MQKCICTSKKDNFQFFKTFVLIFKFHVFISEMATSLYPNVTLHRVEAFNITDSFEQRKQEFLTTVSADVGLHGAESFYHTDKFIHKFKIEIENTPPARFADVNVNVQELVGIVNSILRQKM